MPDSRSACLIVIAGHTASGKTDVAISVAKHFGCEIISADSRQFYRELKIGTAAPTEAQLAAVKHHFAGHLSIEDSYDVYRYEKEALELLDSLFMKERFAVLTGGSGLYIQAVCEGFDELPDSDQEVRAELRRIFESEGLPALRQMLRKLDPAYAAEVDPSNPNRILRALEVSISTGKPYSSFRKGKINTRPFRIIKICLDLPRQELHERINRRVDDMIKAGLVDEARAFYPHRTLNALNTVGYKELFSHFNRECSLEEAIENIKTNTRRYARRQITWFRRDREMTWCAPDPQEIIRVIEEKLRQIMP